MNKTKIEYCDLTYNPISGCNHSCPYCYARNICESPRFNGRPTVPGLHVLTQPAYQNGKIVPWPFGFAPTFNRFRLSEPYKTKKPSTIFVCDMSDMFGSWITDEWIGYILQSCRLAPQHRYLFLTKNPERYPTTSAGARPNEWIGASATNESMFLDALKHFSHPNLKHTNRFISLEPWLDRFSLPKDAHKHIQWLIIGGLTGKGARVPNQDALQRMILDAHKQNIPVFVKSNAGTGYCHDLPWSD